MRFIRVALVAALSGDLLAQNRPLPIIDMHLHANRADDNGPPPPMFALVFKARTRPTAAMGGYVNVLDEETWLRQPFGGCRDR